MQLGEPAERNNVERSRITIRMLDERARPMASMLCRIELPDGDVVQVTLDADGTATLQNIEHGTCKVSFPELADGLWGPTGEGSG